MSNNRNNNIGSNIKYYREAKHLSQAKLAKQIGVSQRNVSYYESGDHIPPADVLKKLASIFDVTVDEILGRNDKQHTNSVLEWRYPPVSNRLGTILKKYREQENLSVTVFSRQLKMDENIYIQIESGKYKEALKLSPQLLKNISSVTGYDIDYIIGAKDSTNISSDECINIDGRDIPVFHSESDFHFRARFEELCLDNHINSDNVEETLGLSRKEFTDIRFNRMPILSELLKIAYAFGVSMDYLIGKTDIRMSTLDKDELELILDYRECPPLYKENIRKRAHDLSIDSIHRNEGSSVAADKPQKTGTTDAVK